MQAYYKPDYKAYKESGCSIFSQPLPPIELLLVLRNIAANSKSLSGWYFGRTLPTLLTADKTLGHGSDIIDVNHPVLEEDFRGVCELGGIDTDFFDALQSVQQSKEFLKLTKTIEDLRKKEDYESSEWKTSWEEKTLLISNVFDGNSKFKKDYYDFSELLLLGLRFDKFYRDLDVFVQRLEFISPEIAKEFLTKLELPKDLQIVIGYSSGITYKGQKYPLPIGKRDNVLKKIFPENYAYNGGAEDGNIVVSCAIVYDSDQEMCDDALAAENKHDKNDTKQVERWRPDLNAKTWVDFYNVWKSAKLEEVKVKTAQPKKVDDVFEGQNEGSKLGGTKDVSPIDLSRSALRKKVVGRLFNNATNEKLEEFHLAKGVQKAGDIKWNINNIGTSSQGIGGGRGYAKASDSAGK